ncbi:hypothetical protein SNOG_11594 [Parastagonospora nodorum SN15]|uniref:Uncharacterized protein n=1 Tax=Phaeosphaeria nodorum (strain SN15 / ATCC MYA-4574 / FGSC 10173) TaxID=321614 RepID=Q0U9H0_PHANO|nr:hypothetical protein SNOG_11594 [Parastagonospora nodorum SN15]EAT81302.1 hypothetical protein SNOG_11594 [Parastagonospora nodorum SN15]
MAGETLAKGTGSEAVKKTQFRFVQWEEICGCSLGQIASMQ